MNERWILLVGSGAESFRGYILESLFNNGFSIFLATDTEPTWENKYIKASTMVQLDNKSEAIAHFECLNKEGALSKIKGILTYVELYVELTAEISEMLALNFYSPMVAELVRDKYKMRECFRTNGLLTPKYTRSELKLENSIKEIGLPCVVKPLKGHSSINVIKIEKNTNIKDISRMIEKEDEIKKWGITPEYIVEEYIEGKEVSVESVVIDGQIIHIAITDKYKGNEPYFEEIAHILPSKLSQELSQKIYETASCGIAALGLDNCVAHTEIKLNNSGIYLIEIGGRLGGDKIPYLAKLALGVDMGRCAGEAAFKIKCSVQSNEEKYAGICFFVPTSNQVVEKIPTDLLKIEGVHEFKFWTKVGDKVLASPDAFFTRLGFVIVQGSSHENCEEIIKEVVNWVSEETNLSLKVPFEN